MNRSKCPHCQQKLGDFLYADACPRCHKVLKHNQPRESAAKPGVAKPGSWPARALARFMPFMESQSALAPMLSWLTAKDLHPL